jgi:hypothetical protein
MLVESLVKATVELQGFPVLNVTGGTSGLLVDLDADRRYAPRCGQCRKPAKYRDYRVRFDSEPKQSNCVCDSASVHVHGDQDHFLKKGWLLSSSTHYILCPDQS